MTTVLPLKLSIVVFNRVLSYHPLFSSFSILLSILSAHKLKTLPCTFSVFLRTPKPETGKWLTWRCHRTPNFWSFLNFRLRQRKKLLFSASKTEFRHLSTRKDFPNYPLSIPSTSMTHTCSRLLHWIFLGYSLPKFWTGNLISLL